jgi:hypothetical protein
MNIFEKLWKLEASVKDLILSGKRNPEESIEEAAKRDVSLKAKLNYF